MAAAFMIGAAFGAYAIAGTAYCVQAPAGSTVVLDSYINMSFDEPFSASSNGRFKLRITSGDTAYFDNIYDYETIMDDMSRGRLSSEAIGGAASAGSTTVDWGQGDKEKILYLYGSDECTLYGLNAFSDSARAFWYVSDYTLEDPSDYRSYMEYAAWHGGVDLNYSIRLNNVKYSANGKSVVVMQNLRDSAYVTYDAPEQWDFNVVSPTLADGSANVASIYPAKYEDLIYPANRDIVAMIPWVGQYPVVNGGLSNLSYTDARNLYNAYSGSYSNSYFNSNYVNSYYRNAVNPNATFMQSNVWSGYTLQYPDSLYNLWITGNLTDYVDTLLPTGAVTYTEPYEYIYTSSSGRCTDKKTSYKQSYIAYSEELLSTWQISTDNTNWVTVVSNSRSQSFDFNAYTKYLRIGDSLINTKAVLGDKNTYYIRRIGNYSSVLGMSSAGFQNVVSPSMKIRTAMELERVTATYIGSGVVAGTFLNEKDVRIDAYYSNDPDVPVAYSGDGSYVEYNQPKGKIKILSVGNENYLRFRFTDPITGAMKEGYFSVRGLEISPISATARYVGPDGTNNHVQGADFPFENVEVTVRFNNGSISIFNGNSSSVAVYSDKDAQRGDVNLDGIINFLDLNALNDIISGKPASDAEKTQADINKDGKIDTKDATEYSRITSTNVKSLGDNVYYAAFKGYMDPANTSRPFFARFTVNGVAKEPYNMFVKENPLKTDYVDSESFDPEGMIVTIQYNNGTYTDVAFTGFSEYSGMVFGNNSHPSKRMRTDETVMPISYTENGKTVSCEVPINVAKKDLSSIYAYADQDKFTYYSGENFDTTGLIVHARFNVDEDGKPLTEEEVSGAELVITSGRNMTDSREYVVIKTNADNGNGGYERFKRGLFFEGEEFNVGDKGTWQRTNGNYVSGEVVGNYLVNIAYTYNGKKASFYQPVEVLGKKLSGIDIVNLPYTTTYVVGSDFNPEGLILKASYTDGSVAFVYKASGTQNGYEVSNGIDLTTDQNTVIVTYTESGITCYAEVPITVTDPSISGITAEYTGGSVAKNESFALEDLLIIINYDNGSVTSFRASQTNEDGTLKVRIVALDGPGDVPEDAPQSTTVTSLGYNYFGAWYAGHGDSFVVVGVEDPSHVNYAGAVADSRRKVATWKEDFTVTKIRTVADFINDGTGSADGLALTSPQSTVDGRMTVLPKDGTAAGLSNPTVSPMINFLREGKWRPSTNSIGVEYKARTAGFLFPEVVNPKFIPENEGDLKYIDAYNQNRSSVLASDDGWSDWVSQGDSVGTVRANRLAYNYNASTLDNTPVTMNIGQLKIRLSGVNPEDNAGLQVIAEDVDGGVVTYPSISETDTITRPARIAINLVGDVTVQYADGSQGKEPFTDIYKINYRSTTGESDKWAKEGEYTGKSETPMQDIEIIIMLQESTFNEGVLSAAPYITQLPQSQNVLCGSRATLNVVAVGNDLGYQWYRDGVAIDDAVEPTYQTPDLYLDDSAVYTCRVYNYAGETMTSPGAKVTVKDIKPRFTVDLTDNIVLTEDSPRTVSLSVEAVSYADDISYVWQTKDSTAAEWQPLSGENTNTIELDVSGLAGKYIRCVATNSTGSSASNYIRVLSDTEASVEIRCDTVFIPMSTTNSVKFTAVVDKLNGTKHFKWFIDGVEKMNANESISYIPSVVGDHVVKVEVENEYGQVVSNTLSVNVKPPITVRIAGETNKALKKVYLRAVVSDTTAGYQVEWIFDGVKINVSDESFTLSEDRKSLACNKLTQDNGYSCQCIVRDRTTGFAYAYDRLDFVADFANEE